MTFRILLKGILVIASLVALGWLATHLRLGDPLSEHWIDVRVRGQGLRGEMLFLGIAALTTALGMPRQIVAFLGGYAFSFLLGAGLALAGTLLGSALAFFYARLFGRALIGRRFPERIRKLDDFLSGHPFSMALIIRLLPVGHNLSTNLIAGVCGVAALPFLTGTALGYVPQTLVFALAGSGVHIEPSLRLSLAVLLFVASSVLGIWLYRRHRHGTAMENDLDRALGESAPSRQPPR